MTRDEFTTGFLSRMRFVLQKHEREVLARGAYDPNATPITQRAALEMANMNTDAAIILLADDLYDALEDMREGAEHAH